jgi:translation elongation factor EF-Ts
VQHRSPRSLLIAAAGTAASLQVNSETDFVARNEVFQGLVSSAAAAALGVTALRPGSAAELEAAALAAARLPGGAT